MTLYGPIINDRVNSGPASGEADGLAKLREIARERPELLIIGVRDLSIPRKVPLWKRLLTGK